MKWPTALLAMVVAAAVAGCGGSGGSASEPATATGPTVFAAASLTEVFPKLDPAALYSFAGSDELAAQIREGAPADVYAAASSKYTQQLYDEGLVEQPVAFASNELVLIVPKDNPAGIDSVDDVAEPGTKLVVAAEGVPVGDYTRDLLQDIGLDEALENVVSNEPDVKAVVSKVALGEADAGFVYATDAAAAGNDVGVIELPEGSQPPIEYQIAIVKKTEHPDEARAFVDEVMSPDGQQKLAASGFLPPP